MGNERNIAMPFHPHCFDIFTRLSLQRLGKLDIHGLISWRNLDFKENIHIKEPSNPEVRRASHTHWAHHVGSEYLAANPIYIPSLIPILESASSVEPGFSPQNSAFKRLNPQLLDGKGNAKNEDPFLKMPQEIREQIVDYLCSTEIAKLRLASRAFYDLPISLWYRLLRREMPWLWEVYSSHIPSFWTALSVADLKREIKQEEDYNIWKAGIRRHIIRQEMREILEQWENDQLGFVGDDPKGKAKSMAESVGKTLNREGTNWYLLYRDIRKAKLKGLRNRERIWVGVGRVVDEIRAMREEGRVMD
jgi:hypothetical protein